MACPFCHKKGNNIQQLLCHWKVICSLFSESPSLMIHGINRKWDAKKWNVEIHKNDQGKTYNVIYPKYEKYGLTIFSDFLP